MASSLDLLALAYRISLLTFNIGVLIYALPIPVPGLKRWAPRLIVDGLFAFLLVTLYDASFALADRVAQLMGGSWAYFVSWLGTGAAEFLSVKALRVIIESLPDPLGILDGVLAILRPIDRLATTALYFLGFVGGLAYIVSEYGRLLAAIGLALFALPFRVARAAGAWLFSFAIVFTAGLQVLPVFVNEVGGPPSLSPITSAAEKGLTLAQLNATGVATPLWGELHVSDYETGEEYAVYRVEAGSVLSSDGLSVVTVPSRPPLVYALEYMDVTLYLAPYPANQSDYEVRNGVWSLTLYSPHAIAADNGLLVYTNGEVVSASAGEGQIEAVVRLDPGGYVAVRYAETCTAIAAAPGLDRHEGEWEWRGVHGYLVKYVAASPGEYEVMVSYQCEPPDFALIENDYLSAMASLLEFFTLNYIEAFINYWFTLPFLYIAVLTSITAGLARALGGRERLPVRVF